MSPDSTYIRTDVTAVTIFNDLMLAGIGSSIYIYSANSTKPVQRLVCLNGQKIYGFKRDLDECYFIVFGGKQFTIVRIERSQDGIVFTRLFKPVVCDDWLHSAVWTPGDVETITVLTAHNVVQKYDVITQNLVSQYSCKDNSILYSGLLVELKKDVLVMAGTVYSEVILLISGEKNPLHRLKGHKGVIFSISCYPEKNIIVTTSDDRSVRIWGPQSEPQVPWDSREYWMSEIVCKHELYGHSARVMRSSITEKHIVSVGEDSHICFWSHDGYLDKKVRRHQKSGIWSIDASGPLLITGGGDGAVTVQSESAIDNYHQSYVMQLDIGKPKHISYSAGGNLFILYESNRFIYYNIKEKIESVATSTQGFSSTFHALSVSPSREICAVAERKSHIQVAIEGKGSKDDCRLRVEFLTIKLENETILSVHWASNTHLVVCTEDGVITVFTITYTVVDPCCKFELPPCKERWLTCAAVHSSTEIFIFGDRCGSIHLYKQGSRNPVKSFNKLHGRYGPTSITIRDDEVITTGRDGTIKYFEITEDKLTHISTKEVDFNWVERFLDIDDKIVCGFKDKMFVVFSLKSNESLLELVCGGGHRSWDVLYQHKKNTAQILNLIYLKDSNINIESAILNTAVSVANGSHSKEINCLKTHQIGAITVFVSGGEDTTLRVSSLDNEMDFEDLAICKRLSSVRTLKMHTRGPYELLAISAGGRAQICVTLFKLVRRNGEIEVVTRDLVDFMLKGNDKQRKGNNNWKNKSTDLEPETRIMDLDYIINKDMYTIFAGCSDARIRVFVFNADELTFKMTSESNYLQSCILKTICIQFLNRDILVTCSTRGDVAFWDATNVQNIDVFEEFFVTKTNQSGINSCVTKNLPDNKLLIATGGDDNALHINILTVPDHFNLSSMHVLHSLVLDRYHSSAITGLCLVNDLLLTTSIDQRITLYVWKVTDKVECAFVYQTFSDVADIKGMDVITHDSSSISLCVFGKGIEVFKIPISQT